MSRMQLTNRYFARLPGSIALGARSEATSAASLPVEPVDRVDLSVAKVDQLLVEVQEQKKSVKYVKEQCDQLMSMVDVVMRYCQYWHYIVIIC